MSVVCVACGSVFSPTFAYQVAVLPDPQTRQAQHRYYCGLECRKKDLGEQAVAARRARRIAILNQKGGTGKTTTSINLAAGLAERGHSTLLIDTDAQGNVGVSLGVRGEKSIYHMLVEGADPADVSIPVRGNLDVITSDATLAVAEVWLAQQPQNRDRILTQRLGNIHRQYSYILVDCGPSLSLMNQNALSYVDEVLIPVSCDYLSLVGVKQVLKTIKDLERHLSHSVQIIGVVPTFYDGRIRLAKEALDTLRGHFQDKLFEPIRRSTRLAEAPSHRQTIFEYDPQSAGAEDYRKLVERVIKTEDRSTVRRETPQEPMQSSLLAQKVPVEEVPVL